MNYILIIWYMALPALGDSAMASPYEVMPGVSGAAVEELFREKTIVILGRYSSKAICREAADDRVFLHLSGIDKVRDLQDIEYSCIGDPK